MKSIIKEVNEKSDDVIKENNLLINAFQSRVSTRLVHIFEKHKITVNNKVITKKIEENLVNNLIDINFEIISKYRYMLKKYEEIIQDSVSKKCEISEIKMSTISFIKKIAAKNNEMLNISVINNLIDDINSMVLLYDSNKLNEDVQKRIKIDTNDIISEINKNNYNYVIESINMIIKNIIDNV